MRRVGISIPDDRPLAEVPELARRVEALGYTDCWSFENAVLDAFTPLAAAAAVTEGLRFGTAIVPVFTRPVGIIAMHAAGMAELAPGRFVLGLGSSTRVVVETWLGVPFGRPLTRTVETVGAVRALLDGEKVGGLRLQRRPAERVPIFMAALGPKMLAAAGELADGLCFFMAGPRVIPQLLAAAGGKLDSMARLPTFAYDSAVDEQAAARRHIVAYALVPYYAALMDRQGFGEEVTGIARSWAAGDRAGAPDQVSQAMLDELTLVGGADRIRERIEAYRAAGLGCPVIAASGPGADRLLRELAGA